jgi:hypothetical protein
MTHLTKNETKIYNFIKLFNNIRINYKNTNITNYKYNVDDYNIFFNRYKIESNSNKKKGKLCNIWEIAQVGRNEVKNSSILAWFFNENSTHGQGNIFLNEFIKHLDLNYKEDFIHNYSTHIEYCPIDDSSSRVDIVIENSKFIIFIENKIDSSEHTEQTKRYYEKLIMSAGNRKSTLIYLTKDKNIANCPDAIPVSWKDIANILIKCINKYNYLPDFIKKLTIQYAAHVTCF